MYYLEHTNYLLASANAFICFKGIMHLRIFEEMRVLISMIGQVIKGMTSFLMLVFVFTLTYFIITFISIDNTNSLEFNEKMKLAFDQSLNIVMVSLDASNFNGARDYIIFLTFFLLIPIVMLNLLISIIGDEFDKF